MVIQHIRELYKYRNLIWTLAWVEFKARYKNSVLGYFWSLLEPLLMLIVLYFVFSNLMKIQVEYFQMFLLQGIIMYNFFSRATTSSLSAIALKQHLIKKVYFPRDILVISGCITALLMSFFESLVFLAFLLYFRIPLTSAILFLPVIIGLFFIITLGTSLMLAAMNVYLRDIQYIWALILQIGFFASPVIYPITFIEQPLRQYLSYNPIAQILFLARDVTLYSRLPNMASFSYAIAVAVILLVIGYMVFLRLEPKFAEAM